MADNFPDEWIDKVCEADPLPDDFDLEDDESIPTGLTLTPEETEAACVELGRWQSVETFSRTERPLRLRNADPDFSPSPAQVPTRCLRARQVRSGIGADQVRLTNRCGQWPDGFVRVSKRTIKVEVTSTHGGRKLGEEYREPRGMQFDPVEDWHARADSIPGYLDGAIRNKVRRYGGRYSDCWLVVYLNIDEWGVRQQEIEQVITEILIRYSDHFREISVLWKGKLYSASDSAMQGHA